MAQLTVISQKELQRQAELCFEGETLKVMLCSPSVTGLNAETAIATWEEHEIEGNGYVRYSTTVSAGSYVTGNGSYDLPEIIASFTASGIGYSYDTVVIFIDGATYPHSIVTESPNIVLLPGQTQTYKITLRQDD